MCHCLLALSHLASTCILVCVAAAFYLCCLLGLLQMLAVSYLYWIFSDAAIVSIEIAKLICALHVLVCSFLHSTFCLLFLRKTDQEGFTMKDSQKQIRKAPCWNYQSIICSKVASIVSQFITSFKNSTKYTNIHGP